MASLAIEADEALELVGGLADELGSDAHGNLTRSDRWFTRMASEWFSLCRGSCRDEE
ncbi:hypothetical protein D3C72_2492610 [compost metagenome]